MASCASDSEDLGLAFEGRASTPNRWHAATSRRCTTDSVRAIECDERAQTAVSCIVEGGTCGTLSHRKVA